MSLRVGCIDYVNILPLTAFLEHPVELGPPSVLNARLAAGSLDTSPISSIEYARHQDEYVLLPDLSISSRGAVRSVMLFSRVPLESLDGRAIGICRATATSRVLLRILLEDYVGVRPHYHDVDEAAEWPAMLLIGDEALAFRRSPRCADYQEHDLGEMWVERTGLPMVFAVWALRRGRWAPEVANLVRDLHASRRRGSQLPDDLLARAQARTGMSWDELRAYYGGLHYTLDNDEQRALLTFYRHASLKGLCPPCERLCFVNDSQPPLPEAACVQEDNR